MHCADPSDIAKSSPSATNIEKRRSKRVLLKIPITISGVDDRGLPFTAEGQTLSVNMHGAKICVNRTVRCAEVHITNVSQQRSQQARVVYVDGEHEGELAIELEKPENVWGVYSPPLDWGLIEAGNPVEQTESRNAPRKRFPLIRQRHAKTLALLYIVALFRLTRHSLPSVADALSP